MSVVGRTGSRSRPSVSGLGCSTVAISRGDFTAWPPNWLRSAAFTFAANAFCPRDEKRSNSEVVITGVAMRLSIESSTVQRPSPESST